MFNVLYRKFVITIYQSLTKVCTTFVFTSISKTIDLVRDFPGQFSSPFIDNDLCSKYQTE